MTIKPFLPSLPGSGNIPDIPNVLAGSASEFFNNPGFFTGGLSDLIGVLNGLDSTESIETASVPGVNQMYQDLLDQQNAFQTESAQTAMQFSADEAQKNRDWQEKMSNSAYSRAVSDLKSAGLNPILAAGGSSMASTPSGSSASGVSQSGAQIPSFEVADDLFSAIGSVFSSAAKVFGNPF